ncbi:MAG: class I SAM-dependent methyltransferase [Bacteroidota bacterium]
MDPFKDYFSKQSEIYARYRPQYPEELYSFLASQTVGHERVWDCGTGNGQAAVDLAAYYDNVYASDPSEQQIKHSIQHPNIIYAIENAEQSSLPDQSVDLITVANAMHWFDLDLFYEEVKRVLKKDGILAAWSYALPSISKEIDPIVYRFHHGILNDYWVAENRLVEKEYTTIPFPFCEISHPDFFSYKQMNLVDTIGYFNTWSAVQRFIAKNNHNPTEELGKELQAVWGNPEMKHTMCWKLALKIGTIV